MRGFLLLALHESALFEDLLLLLFQTLQRLRLGLLALPVGLFRGFSLALGGALILQRGGFLFAGEQFLGGLQFLAFLLRGTVVLFGFALLFFGGERGGFGSLFLPLGGGFGFGVQFARRPFLFGAEFFGVRLRGSPHFQFLVLLFQVGPLPRGDCGLLGGDLRAGRGGTGFRFLLLFETLLFLVKFFGISPGGALPIRLQFLPLGCRLHTGCPGGFRRGLRLGDGRIAHRWLPLAHRWSAGFAGRTRTPGGWVGFGLRRWLHSDVADARCGWRHDDHGFARRLLWGTLFVGFGLIGSPRFGGAGGCRHGGHRRSRGRGGKVARRWAHRPRRTDRDHRRRSCLSAFSAAVFAVAPDHRARLGERWLARSRDRRMRGRRHVGGRPARRRTITFAARPLAGKTREHRVRVALHRHHLQIRREHRPGRRGGRREPLGFALKSLPQFRALFPVFHARPAAVHLVRGEGLFHLRLQKLAPHRGRDQRRVDQELIPDGPRIGRKATRSIAEIRPVELRAAHQF